MSRRYDRDLGCLAIIGLVILFIIIFCLVLALEAVVLMWLLAALASMTGWSCAIGFWPCVIICLIFSLLCGGGSRASSN